jgi:hypothetical protein
MIPLTIVLAAPESSVMTIVGRATLYIVIALVSALVLVFVAFFIKGFISGLKEETNLSAKQKEYEAKIQSQPDDTKVAWDLARVTLEKYFSRNLRQVAQIFYTSISVMLVGFGMIVFGAVLAIHQDETSGPQVVASNLPSNLSVLSGIVTEFIGATFMVIYRSTLRQAEGYMAILERINAVGMAVQIVDSIKREDPLYTQTRANMAQMLLEQFRHTSTASTDSGKAKS